MEETLIDTRLEQKLGFDRIRKAVADKCVTEYAVNRAMEETFVADGKVIRDRLLLTDEMRLILMFEENFPTSGYIDCLGFLKLLETPSSYINLLSLRKLRTMLETVRKVTGFFSSIRDGIYPCLKKMAEPVMCFPEVQRQIDLILDKFGEVRDTASPELASIRKTLRDTEGTISRRVNAILKKIQEDGIADKDASVSVRDGKLLIPVPAVNKKKVQGFIYDESSSGKTAFIEPAEIVELDNRIKELRFAENREILRILTVFTDFLRPYVPDLLDSAEFLGEMDFIMAKAGLALDMISGMPVLSSTGEMSVRKARHPLLEKALKREKKEIVPLTITLTDQKRILMISGPNAGGKSVCLKTVGLLQYMFQWGMLVPVSESSEMMVFDRIMVDIGDDQSIDNDLSTYSSFLSNMKDILQQADDKTLVLIDEFGSGTEPAAGGAIAEAILAELDRRGTYGVITTHYTNLKLYASRGDTHVANGAMMFDVQNIAPLFRLEMGLPGNSFAFELARKMGAKILQASTSEIYGDPLVHPQTEDYRGNVNTIGPRACYDEGKRVAETLFSDYRRMYGTDARIIRIFNTYGPHMLENDGRVVSNFIMQAIHNKNITIYGDGTQTRSFCYVDDLVAGMIAAMDKADFTGPVNLGNPCEMTILELAKMIIRKTGSGSQIVYRPLPVDDPVKRKPDISFARKELDWEPQTDIEQGIRKTIEYFRMKY